MTTELALPSTFKDMLREKILSMCMDMIPKEKLDELIEKEVKDFFDTEQLLTIKETTITVDNVNYDPRANSWETNGKKKLDCPTLTFGSKMTPFRQLVWSCLYQHLKPKIEQVFEEEHSAANVALVTWMAETARPGIKDSYVSQFSHLSTVMSSVMLQNVLQAAMNQSHDNLKMALQQAGVDTRNLPMFPRPRVPGVDIN